MVSTLRRNSLRGTVVDALAAAERTRGSLVGAVMHTDHGAPVHEPGIH
ncbi:hypothetical protein [Streptomyces sp. ISL-98]|nr:hypothetical protein [Streptomyces sp. ISL-98]